MNTNHGKLLVRVSFSSGGPCAFFKNKPFPTSLSPTNLAMFFYISTFNLQSNFTESYVFQLDLNGTNLNPRQAPTF